MANIFFLLAVEMEHLMYIGLMQKLLKNLNQKIILRRTNNEKQFN